MYEKNMKEEFIEEYRRSRIIAKASLTGLFNKTEAFELARGKDCSRFSEEEILDMYMQFNAGNVRTLLNCNAILRAYTEWINSNYDGAQNAYDRIGRDMLELIAGDKAEAC